MKKLLILLPFVLFLISNKHIDADKERWKTAYVDIQPDSTVSQWLVPFKTKDRTDYKTTRLVSSYGSNRNSYLKGHKHTGLDCIPKEKQDTVDVYPMGEGVVCSIHLGDPHRTIVIRHKSYTGREIFTSYKHLGDIYVQTGQQVEHNTRLARLYTREEALILGGNYDHLHLEIRKDFKDYGCASWLTMTEEELKKRFIDPWWFFKNKLGERE